MFLQSKKKVIASSDQISRKLKENDPREKYVKCEALPGGIFQKVKTDPKDLSLTLLKHTPFWMDWQNYKPVRAEGISEIRPIGNELYTLHSSFFTNRIYVLSIPSHPFAIPILILKLYSVKNLSNLFEYCFCSVKFYSIILNYPL